MSGFLFLIVMDWIMRTVGYGKNGIGWKFTSKLDDLNCPDDVAILSSTKQQIQDKTIRLDEETDGTQATIVRRDKLPNFYSHISFLIFNSFLYL